MFTFFVRVQSRPAPNSFPLHSSHRPYLCVLLGDLSVYCLSTPLPLLAASLHFSTVHLYVREVCFICYMSFSFSSVSVTVSISISVSFRGECVCGIIICSIFVLCPCPKCQLWLVFSFIFGFSFVFVGQGFIYDELVDLLIVALSGSPRFHGYATCNAKR